MISEKNIFPIFQKYINKSIKTNNFEINYNEKKHPEW